MGVVEEGGWGKTWIFADEQTGWHHVEVVGWCIGGLGGVIELRVVMVKWGCCRLRWIRVHTSGTGAGDGGWRVRSVRRWERGGN